MSKLATVLLPAAVLLVACGGSSSTELFEDPIASSDLSEDAPQEEARSATVEAPDTSHDAGREVDANADADANAGADAEADADAGAAPDGGPRCYEDDDCATGICNWKTDRCAATGPVGAPCKRDLECTAGLCNWELETCTEASPSGTPCRRNKECASGVCALDRTCD